MNYQDIIISHDIFQKISNDFTGEFNIDLKSYKDNLLNKRIIFDKNETNDSVILKKIQEIKGNANDIAKTNIDCILKNFLSNSNKIRYVLSRNDIEFTKNKEHNFLFNLCVESKSHIINSEDSMLELSKTGKEKLQNIEILNIDNFISPSKISKVFSLKKTIRVDHNQYFKYEEYFKPYLGFAKNLLINDKYLRRPGAIRNLIKIIKLCDEVETVNVYTITKDNGKDNFEINTEELLKRLNECTSARVIISDENKKIEHLRFIVTDEFRIDIDPGLNFVDEYYKAKYSSIKIDFSKIDNIDNIV